MTGPAELTLPELLAAARLRRTGWVTGDGPPFGASAELLDLMQHRADVHPSGRADGWAPTMAVTWPTSDVPVLRLAVELADLGAPDQVLRRAVRWARKVQPEHLAGPVAVVADVRLAHTPPPADLTFRLARPSAAGWVIAGTSAWVIDLGAALGAR